MLPFTLQQLRILKAIANEKSFTKASKVLNISQPSLSKQIRKLEKILNLILINRNNTQFSLTEHGEIFLKYSDRILALCEESCRALTDIKIGNRGYLNVGASQTIGTYLIPKLLTIFKKNYPQIKLTFHVNLSEVVIKNILNYKLDIGIINGPIPHSLKNNLTITNFIEDEMALIVSKNSPFLKNKIINKNDLYDLNFIGLNYNSNIRKFIDSILKQNKIETKKLKIILQLNSVEGIKTAVSLGLGVAFLSSSIIEKEIKFNLIETINIKDIKVMRIISIISNPTSFKSTAFHLFYNELYFFKKNLCSILKTKSYT